VERIYAKLDQTWSLAISILGRVRARETSSRYENIFLVNVKNLLKKESTALFTNTIEVLKTVHTTSYYFILQEINCDFVLINHNSRCSTHNSILPFAAVSFRLNFFYCVSGAVAQFFRRKSTAKSLYEAIWDLSPLLSTNPIARLLKMSCSRSIVCDGVTAG